MTRFVVALQAAPAVNEVGLDGGLERAGPGGALDRDLGVEDPGEVRAGREQDQQDRQDHGQLDDRLAARAAGAANEPPRRAAGPRSERLAVDWRIGMGG